jgi:hypothetical protein
VPELVESLELAEPLELLDPFMQPDESDESPLEVLDESDDPLLELDEVDDGVEMLVETLASVDDMLPEVVVALPSRPEACAWNAAACKCATA